MARFRGVDFYPFEGFPDRLWGPSAEGSGDPLADAFLRAARPVVALYSEALEQVHVDGPRGSLMIFVTERLEPTDVRLVVWAAEPTLGPERAFVTLCPPVGRLDATGRAGLALDVVHAAVRELAAARGWDPDVFDACRDHVVAHDHVYTWDGPWRTSPDRRHQARARYRISDPDGFARARLEVRRRADGTVVVSSPQAVGFCTTRDLRASASTLQWSGSGEVGFSPHARVVSTDPAHRLAAQLHGDTWVVRMPRPVAVRAPGGEGVDEATGAPVPAVTVSC